MWWRFYDTEDAATDQVLWYDDKGRKLVLFWISTFLSTVDLSRWNIAEGTLWDQKHEIYVDYHLRY
jgi:hypothetical protein